MNSKSITGVLIIGFMIAFTIGVIIAIEESKNGSDKIKPIEQKIENVTTGEVLG